MSDRKVTYWPFKGGMDFVTPPITVPEGRMIAGRNFEPWIDGGYRRIAGYERYDGRPKPSDASWVRLTLTVPLPVSPAVVVGNAISGQTSGATGVIIEISADRLYLYLTKVVGTFVTAELLDDDTLPAVAFATTVGVPQFEYSDTIDHEASLRLLAETEYRTDIQQLPGEGVVRGIWQIRDRLYGFRNNIGSTACIIHKATATGWDTAPIELCKYVYYNTGTAVVTPGQTLTGATSGATGLVHRVIIHRGAYGTSDAQGYIALTGVTGSYTNGENLQVGGVTKCVAAANMATLALPPGGRYSFVSENFYAGLSSYRVYAAGGEGPAIEIDEDDVVCPILMDLTLGDAPAENKPFLVESFDGRLWLGLAGGSVQHSIVGDPLTWNGFLGAAEYGLGDDLTSLTAVSGDVLVARTRRQTHAFYKGTTYTKKIISDRAGGILYSDQELNTSYAADDGGLTTLDRVDTFGDFSNATISDLIQPYMASRKELVAGSMVVRDSSQYRLLYSSGEGVIARIRPDGVAEFGILSLPTTVHCAYSCEDANGTPTNWFGGASGYVYQAEIGRNFDGAEIEATARLPFNHQGQPSQRKRYRLLELELAGERAVELYMAADLSYAGQETGSYYWEDRVVGGGGFFDADNWDQIYWDAQTFSTARFELLGTGRNLSVLFYSHSNTTAPFILQGAQLHYDMRRVQR